MAGRGARRVEAGDLLVVEPPTDGTEVLPKLLARCARR